MTVKDLIERIQELDPTRGLDEIEIYFEMAWYGEGSFYPGVQLLEKNGKLFVRGDGKGPGLFEDQV